MKSRTTTDIMINFVFAAVSLFFNGFGIYLVIQAGIGVAPWDVFSLGLSKTFGILYGTASIAVSVIILAIDIYMKEPIGIGTVLCAVFQGPIMQAAFKSLSFDATNIEHQSIPDSIKVLTHKHA